MLRTQEEQKLKDLAARKKHSLGSTSKLDGSVSPRYTGSGAISSRKLSPRPEMASKTDLALRTEMTPRTDRNKTTNVPRSTTPGNRNGEEMNYVRITTKGEGKDSRDPYQPPRNSNAFIQAIDNIQRSSNQMLEYLLTSRNSKHLLNRSSTPGICHFPL